MMTKYSEGEGSSILSLPNDWSEIKIQKLLDKGLLIDHLDGNHGELYPSAEEFSDEGVPYVSANNFSNGIVDLEGCKKIPETRAKLFKKGIARNDDVIFAHNATVGPVALLKTDLDYVILGTTATYYRCNNDKLLNQYLLYAMQSNFFVKQYSKVMFQSTRSQVPITAQRKLSLLIPSYHEQKAIAQVLSTADAVILTTDKLIVQKELRKKWFMQQLLTGKKRLKGFDSDWIKCNASDFLDQRNEQAPNNGNIPLFSLTIENGVTEKSDRYEREFLVKDKSNKNYKIVHPNDIVFNPANLRWGAIGMHTRTFKVLLSPIYEVLSVKEGYDINFISYLVSSPRQIAYYASILEGTLIERMAVKVEPFLATKYEIPKKEEQTAIARVLQAADKEISLLKAKAEKLREQKKGLMQQLLTGKVRLKTD